MKKWQRKEQNDAEDFGGFRTPGSGNKDGFKGDVKTDDWLIECKHTTRKGFRITNTLWDKCHNEALLADRRPILSIELGSGKEVVVLDKNDFIEIAGNIL